jgi:hypothetical protein
MASGKTLRMPCISAWEGLGADRWPVKAELLPIYINRKVYTNDLMECDRVKEE